eukprot:scaffold7549_cov111-Isochrysis_galbana.AAC.16
MPGELPLSPPLLFPLFSVFPWILSFDTRPGRRVPGALSCFPLMGVGRLRRDTYRCEPTAVNKSTLALPRLARPPEVPFLSRRS